jgi:hypothetical protein
MPYADGQVDAEGCYRRSHLYADGQSTPTAVLVGCPGQTVWPSAYSLAVGALFHSYSVKMMPLHLQGPPC